ncbi:MAG: tetratricopeptide repeat protein, partial [Treponema sp.]|nr:tetratricopeptide repeat protein [Treponema sp.]
MGLIVILGIVFVLALLVVFILLIMGRTGKKIPTSKKRSKNREAMINVASKRLEQNPNDANALNILGDIYFEEESWDKAMKMYEALSEIIFRNPVPGLDSFNACLRYGMSAIKLSMTEQAYKGFSMARVLRQDVFEVNYNLGALEFERKNYEKALQLLQQARIINPESPAVLRYMGHAFFRMKKPKEAMALIRKAIDLAPEDKESLYTLAECYYEAKHTDQAL